MSSKVSWGNGLLTLPHQISPSVEGSSDDEFVVGRASGVGAGRGDQRSLEGQMGFTSTDGLLIELGDRQIPVDLAGGTKVLAIDAKTTDERADVIHVNCAPAGGIA